ncbi:lytic polysaccharide monooxygenase, partial [Kitasatospora cineracea]
MEPLGGGRWTVGQQLTLTWSIEARHATTSFRYFLTKPGYDAT